MSNDDIKHVLILEETFQILSDFLEHCPFENKNSPTKKHIFRLKQLLGPEFSIRFAETGSLFFSSLVTAESYFEKLDNLTGIQISQAKKIFDQLLLTCQYIMLAGLHSRQVTNSLMNLKDLCNSNANVNEDVVTVINSSLVKLQFYMCASIIK